MAVLFLLFAVDIATAQGINSVLTGECSKLRVEGCPGNSFFWKIFNDRNLKTEVSTGDVEFLEGNSGAEVIVKWNKTGEYYFRVQSFTPSGCSNLKVGKMQVLDSHVVANAGADTLIGSCRQMILNGSASQGDIIRYEWSIINPGGIIINAGSKIAEFSLSSSYKGDLPAKFRIKLMVTDRFGNTDSDTTMVEIDNRPMAKIVFTDNFDIKDHKILDGTNSFGTKIGYDWYTGNGTIISDNKKPVVIVKVPGIYSLLVKDKYGCESSITQKLFDLQKVLIANPDYGRCSWADELIISVLDNDYSSDDNIIIESVVITENPMRGNVIVLNGGVLKYIPYVCALGRDKFKYKVSDEYNLCDSTEVIVDVFDPPIGKTDGFSPNGDGLNDLFVFKDLENYPGSKLRVFTVNGLIIYKSDNYLNDWDGKILSRGTRDRRTIPSGSYYYVLKLGGANRTLKGSIYIVY
ncbi:MAG: gliding motility-associated C-terminal domain-containing protein [Bacteroidia bacterium]|nr:gliding motility-associated C-terminal domain-containing protein [Bacteroidia bacterium]